MNWYQIVLLVALVLVSGAFASFVFQVLKRWAPTNDFYRQVVVWVLCVIIALAFAQLAIFGRPTWSCDNFWPIAVAVFAFAKIWYTAIAWKVPGLKAWWDRHGLKDPTTTQ